MSNLGQGIAAVAGGVIGYFVGGPTGAAYGFQLGLMAGTALFPTKLPGVSGPRLNDQRTTTSEVGGGVAIVYGTYAVAGQVMYLGALEEVKTTEDAGGKGAPSQESTTYTYFQPIAIGLCEGVIDGILRVWENGELVYDARQDASSEGDAVLPPNLGGFFGHAVSGIVAKSSTYQDSFTLYLGDEDQLPDPTLEADLGVGEVPAFRGLAYIVYHRRQLLDKQGLRHPNFKFEVVRNGQFECIDVVEYSNEQLHDWFLAGNPVNPKNINVFTLHDGVTHSNSLSEAVEDWRGHREVGPLPHIGWPSAVFVDAEHLITGDGVDGVGQALGGHSFANQGGTQANLIYLLDQPDIFISAADFASNPDLPYTQAPGSKIYFQNSLQVNLNAIYTVDPDPPADADYYPFDALEVENPLTYWGVVSSAIIIPVERFPAGPLDPCEDQPNATVPGFCVIDGYLVAKGTWSKITHGVDTEDQFRVLRVFFAGSSQTGSNKTRYPLNPCMPVGSADDNEAFWTAAYDAAVASGDMPLGMTYVSDDSGDGLTTYPQAQEFAWVRTSTRCTGGSEGISLAEIVTDICARVALTRLDVSELASKEVLGYGINSPMPARAAIDPLKSVGFFDVVESPPYLSFRVRGRAPSITFGTNEMGAYDDGSDNPPPVITTRELQDVELPRSVRVHYLAPSRDYDSGEQQSASRITTKATNDVDVELAVCLEDTDAKRIADVLWADAWRSRWIHTTSLDQLYIGLEPADTLITPIDGELERLRITSIDDSIPTLRGLEMCRDDDGSYVSVAVADVPDRVPNVIQVLSPTDVVLMDLPSLRDSDNDAGIYVAAQVIMANGVWHGGILRYSVNEGQTFTDLATVTTEAVVGSVITPAGYGITTAWDDANEIVVRIARGELSNKTEQEVIEKNNSAAIGVDGRWEIVQFTTAEEISPEHWKLSHLLRGRKGTEYLVGTGQVGDTFVLLSGPGIVRASLDASEIGVPRLYKSISIGASADTGIEKTFATHGICLLPYSVVYLQGSFDVDGNLTLTWIRRGRLGHELTPGVEIPLSEAYERYEVEFLTEAGVLKETYTVNTATTLTYSYVQQGTDFGRSTPMVIRVYQISDIKGRGTVDEITIVSSPALEPVLPPIDYPSIYARITFGGTPDGNEDVLVQGTYAPKNSAATNIRLIIDGTSKTNASEYADDLFAYLNGLGLPSATANVSQPDADTVQIRAAQGDTLALYATPAYPTVTFAYDTQYNPLDLTHSNPWQGGTYRIEAPIQDGVKQQFSIDLYQILGGLIEGAPDTDNAYRNGGAANIHFTVYALDYDVNQAMAVPYQGQEIVLNWTAPNAQSDLRVIAVADLVANNGLPKPIYTLLAQYADFVGFSSVGGRQLVYVTMKYGYWVAVDLLAGGWQSKGSHPSGFLPGTQEVIKGVMRYPSGAKWMSGVDFFHFNDSEFYVSGLGGWEAGMSIEVTVDAITASYTIDGIEATALNSTDNSAGGPFVTTYNAILDDLKTQVETGGNFAVKHEVFANGQYRDWRIERTVVDTPVAFSGQVTGYDLTIVNEKFDEDNSP